MDDFITKAPLSVIKWHQDVLVCTPGHANAKGELEGHARFLLHSDVSGVSLDDRILLFGAFSRRAKDVGLDHLIHAVQKHLIPDGGETQVCLGIIVDLQKERVMETTPLGTRLSH